MMMLPIHGFGNQSGKQGKKRGKFAKDKSGNDSVQINLIVDPSLFGNAEKAHGDDRENNETRSGNKGNRKGIFEGLALEKQWLYARSSLKLVLLCDISAMILWTAVFVLILMGQRCPSGQFIGWCVSLFGLFVS